jgi:hypothetical protein
MVRFIYPRSLKQVLDIALVRLSRPIHLHFTHHKSSFFDMETISAVFAGSVIRKGFGKLSAHSFIMFTYM